MTRRGARCSNQAVTDDLAPLCDQHHSLMRRSKTIRLTFQGCTEDEFCRRRYHPLIGYYAGQYPTEAPEIYCVTHFHRLLYVCAYDAKRDVRKYACPVPGCDVTEWLPAHRKSSRLTR
jgi:hypothetical protein